MHAHISTVHVHITTVHAHISTVHAHISTMHAHISIVHLSHTHTSAPLQEKIIGETLHCHLNRATVPMDTTPTQPFLL